MVMTGEQADIGPALVEDLLQMVGLDHFLSNDQHGFRNHVRLGMGSMMVWM